MSNIQINTRFLRAALYLPLFLSFADPRARADGRTAAATWEKSPAAFAVWWSFRESR